jgi:hypothetical protein
MKRKLRPPGTERLKPKYDKRLTSSAFKPNMRRYNQAARASGLLRQPPTHRLTDPPVCIPVDMAPMTRACGAGQGLILVHVSAQLEQLQDTCMS